jgi:hypothetical protein
LGAAGTAVLTLLFFVLYYLYLWFVVDLRLIYHGGGMILDFPVFYRGGEFFHQTVSRPGGLVEYASAFLAQFFHIGWAGAIIATVQAWLLWLLSGTIIRIAGGRRLGLVPFAAAILLIIFYARYVYPFGIVMGVLAALVFTCLYIWATSKRRATDLLVFVVLSAILYVIAGGVCVLFVAVCGVYEAFLRHRPGLGIIFLLSAAIITHIVSIAVFNVNVLDVLNDFMPLSYKSGINNKEKFVLFYALYLLVPVTLVFSCILEILLKMRSGQMPAAQKMRQKTEDKEQKSLLSRLMDWQARNSTMTTGLIAIIALGFIALFLHNLFIKSLIAVDYYSDNKMWGRVLEISVRYPRNQFINHAVNRALYHTGRLADDMFVYEQQPTALLLSTERENPVRWWWIADTYIDLGHMNLAESMVALVMDTYGERPFVLRRMALINMAKGETGEAKVYLGALSRTLFDDGWANDYLEKIEADPNLSTDNEIQRLRSMIPTTDRDFKSLNENIFTDLLEKNKGNRMAFEYLTAFYLLTGQLDKFAGTLNRLEDFDYGRVPRVYEEAILLYKAMQKKDAPVRGEISAESRSRFNGFSGIFQVKYGANKLAAFYELSRDYGDSYFFYFVYGHSGMKE